MKHAIEYGFDLSDRTVKNGDLIHHPATDSLSLENWLKRKYPNIKLVPVSPGTALFTELGPNWTYVDEAGPISD